MRRTPVILVGVVASAVLAAGVWAAAGETPFPSPTISGVFVASHTVTAPSSPLGGGQLATYFPQGSTVVFQVFAGATKSGKILTGDDVKYAYVKLPDGTSVKLTYAEPKKTTDPAWSGTWTVPAAYPVGTVNFTVRFQTKDKKYGNFVQIPVETSQLHVTKA
jgi:hypothetical protein